MTCSPLIVSDRPNSNQHPNGYMAKVLIQATLPYKALKSNEYRRKNGNFELYIWSPVGIPYGSIPRLLLAWITTEAVRTQSPHIVMGESLSKFMQRLDLSRRGGVRGDITRLREQMERLLCATIRCRYSDDQKSSGAGYMISSSYSVWWQRDPNLKPSEWTSSITLSQEFFQTIVSHPIPVDFDILREIKQSPMALDIYMWLVYRAYRLDKRVTISWQCLADQFGTSYQVNTDDKDRYRFAERFSRHLHEVAKYVPGVNVSARKNGVILSPPSPPSAKSPPESPVVTDFVPIPKVSLVLHTDTYEAAKKAAPGYDVYYLEHEWRQWLAKSGKLPDNPDLAFIGFCRKRAKHHPLR